ncbi:MAG TPA: biotin-dependent carboxyltransferase family protein [Herpetosiphonaceae bacterium]
MIHDSIPVLHVLAGGVLTTVQDLGRYAARRYGVPQSGALDNVAAVAANRLLDNPSSAATLEMTAGGADFEVLAPTLLALTGADLGAALDDEPLPLWMAVFARAGARLRLTGRRAGWGARAYLAVAGGFDVPPVLGSCSTYLPGGFGGLHGRALRAGDLLHAPSGAIDAVRLAGRSWPPHARPAYAAQPVLRVLPGPHVERFAADALDQLVAAPLQVSASSNRMGYRLEGPSMRYAVPWSLPSLGVLPGVVQVPPDGSPILLMADAQTTGGYPIVGVVIGPDLPLAAQLLPGDRLRFAWTTPSAALAARHEMQRWRGAVPDDDLYPLAWAGA